MWLLPAGTADDMLRLFSATPEEPEMPTEELVEIVQPDSLQDLNVDSTMKEMLSELDKGPHRMQMVSGTGVTNWAQVAQMRCPPFPHVAQAGGKSRSMPDESSVRTRRCTEIAPAGGRATRMACRIIPAT